MTDATEHVAENVADRLTHFRLVFVPDLARADDAGAPCISRSKG